MDHEIAREPRIDAWQGILQHVEFHELDIGMVRAVLDDEVMDDIGADISEIRRPRHVLHPVVVATGRIEQRAEGVAAGEIGKVDPDGLVSLEFRTPTTPALVIVPPVLLEDVGENLLGIAVAETVYGHLLIDERARAGRYIIADRSV